MVNMTTLFDFIKQHFNQPNVGNTPENKGQCVGLISVWQDELGVAHEWGDAKDLLKNADTSKFEIVLNTIDAIPVPGDIFVCGSNWGGGFGHTGIIVFADLMKMVWFEQNNPTGSKPILTTHEYDNRLNGLIGWLHPKQGVITDQQTLIDQLKANLQTETTLYENERQHTITQEDRISEKQKIIDSQTKQLQTKDERIKVLEDENQAFLDDSTASKTEATQAKTDLLDCKKDLEVKNDLLNHRKDLFTWSWKERFYSLFVRG